MAKPDIDTLIRMVEREIGVRESPPDGPAGAPAEDEESDWRMLEHLRELWRVHDPKLPGERASHRRIIGPPVRAAKALFRFACQPFINETLNRQAEFDRHTVSVLEEMRASLLVLRQRLDALAAGEDPAHGLGPLPGEERRRARGVRSPGADEPGEGEEAGT